MKFTIHTLRPCREGEAPTHEDMRLSSIAVEAHTLGGAILMAEQKTRKGERLVAWSPEPSRSYGGEHGHRELYVSAISCGRVVVQNTARSALQAGRALPFDYVPPHFDDNVVDAEIPCSSCGVTAPDNHLENCATGKLGARASVELALGVLRKAHKEEQRERELAAAMGDLPGKIRRALQAMEDAYGPAIATGIFLDNIGAQFNVRRVLGESDEAYRARMGEEISERKHELASTCRAFVADKQAEHAAELEYASWKPAAKPRAAAKTAWHSLSPDLARSTHQVAPEHGSALLPELRAGKA